MNTLQLGLVLTGVAGDTTTPSEQVAGSVALTAAARDHGFSHLAVGQHFLGYPYQYLQPIPLLSRLSAESGELRLTTGVLILPLLHPVDVAEQLATLDVLCGGRLVTAVGIGYRDEEFAAFGVDRSTRSRRMLESLAVMSKLWAGGSVDHDGEYIQLRGARSGIQPIQTGGPPVWIAGMRGPTVERAIGLGHLPFVGPGATLDQVSAWAQHLRRLTGDPLATIPLRRDVFVGPTPERAIEDALHFAARRLTAYQQWGMGRDAERAHGPQDSAARESRQILDDNQIIVGDADDCADRLQAFADAGAGPIIVRVQWPGLPLDRSLHMIGALSAAGPGPRLLPRPETRPGRTERGV